MGTDAADILMASLPPLGWEDLATKTDLDLLRAESAQQHADLRAESERQHAEMTAKFTQQHADLRAEFTQQLAAQVGELDKKITSHFRMTLALLLGLFGLPIVQDMIRPPQPAPIVITIASPTPAAAPAPAPRPVPSGRQGPADQR